MQKNIQEYIIHSEKEIDKIDISLEPGDRVFFVGDLGAGKSTCIRNILRKHLDNTALIVRSPTYTYYQSYCKPSQEKETQKGEVIYHFDLYRLEDYDTFISIGGEEILENKDAIALIEWPEILGENFSYTKKISIEFIENESRKVILETLTI